MQTSENKFTAFAQGVIRLAEACEIKQLRRLFQQHLA
jgi:hypothetical protein